MYTLRFFLKSFFVFFISSCSGNTVINEQIDSEITLSDSLQANEEPADLVLGAYRLDAYLPLLEGKTIGVVANQTSMIGEVHLVDTLLALGQNLKAVYSPEHGFRGDADAGAKVASGKDERTGLPLLSLYGKTKKPTPEQLEGVDLMIFDIQDVGARFYTYISTLHYVMEACAEEGIAVLVLDRPNPNGHYVDGPVLKEGYTSFVGMHPIPIVHGMTIGEYAQMINGEGWLKNKVTCNLTVIPCENYDRMQPYELPVPPSPNLRTSASIALYPSLCLFEGTIVSEGRGTPGPFERFGHPKLPADEFPFSFTPESSYGAKHPKLEGKKCQGLDLKAIGEEGLDRVELKWLINSYNAMPQSDFFITKNRWFDLLAGSDELRKMITAGKSIPEIRASWQADLDHFKSIRGEYLLY